MALTPAERQIAAAVGFDEDICDLIVEVCRGSIRRMTVAAGESGVREVEGIAVALDRDKAMIAIGKLQSQLLPRGYRAFCSALYDTRGSKRKDVVTVLKSIDESAIIQLHSTEGGNYDVSTETLLEKIRQWRGQCELEVTGAGSDWVAIRFATLPKNICSLAEEIYEFCPDTVEQGVGLQNEKDDPEKFEAARKMFPKLSAKMEQKIDEQKAMFATLTIPPAVRAMIDSSGFNTPTDMGIRLLAYELNETRQLLLWWD